MFRLLIATIILAITNTVVFAQRTDSLFVSNKDDNWQIAHKVQPGETLFSLSRRFHVPPAMLADANGISYNGDLTGKSMVKIPMGAYNQARTPVNTNESRPVYYRVSNDDNLYKISKKAGVQQYKLQELNNMPDNSVTPGQVLIVGYILYDATEMPVVTNPRVPAAAVKNNTPGAVNTQPRPATPTAVLPATPQADTFRAAVDTGMSKGEQLYLEQTAQGQNIVTEKGPAAFFQMSAGTKGLYLGFHNTAPKGSIVRVHNPGNGKDIYVKIIGPLPNNKKFYNALIGISNQARTELGTVEQRLWVEMSYAGY